MTTIHKSGLLFSADHQTLTTIESSGLAVSKEGVILAVGKYSELRKTFPKSKVIDHGKSSIILPGFVDAHVHAPQYEMMGSCGHSLIDWLEKSAFPTELKYSSASYAKKQYAHFLDDIVSKGTTTAAIYGTTHFDSTWALMDLAEKKGLRSFVGKVLMDQNAPKGLLESPQDAKRNLDALFEKSRKFKRTRNILTVRFAPTSTEELLTMSGQFCQTHPELLIQTHMAETKAELQWVKELFSRHKNYAAVYEDFGLLGKNTLFAHCIYLSDDERERLKNSGSKIVHCPTSNFFLGSGVFNLKANASVHVAMGSDVGGGWDLSMHQTATGAYSAAALHNEFLTPEKLLYLASRAGALALNMSDVGELKANFKGDFVVYDLKKDLRFERRAAHAKSPEEILSCLMILDGSKCVKSVFVDGKKIG